LRQCLRRCSFQSIVRLQRRLRPGRTSHRSTPSSNIAFVFGLGTYALPIMAIASWMLTVSLLKGSTNRIGKKKFWLVVSIPLVYQIFVVIVSNPNLVTDPNLIVFLYSPHIQFLVAINGQISGLFFAVALTLGRSVKLLASILWSTGQRKDSNLAWNRELL